MTHQRPLDELLLPQPGKGFEKLKNVREDSITVRLSRAASEEARLLAEQYLQSQVMVIRNALIIHVYGRLNFDRFVLHGFLDTPLGHVPDVVDPKRLQAEIMSAVPFEAERARELDEGSWEDSEQLEPLRIEVPAKLKEDLQFLAADKGQSLSKYCRDVLTRYYLGALAS